MANDRQPPKIQVAGQHSPHIIFSKKRKSLRRGAACSRREGIYDRSPDFYGTLHKNMASEMLKSENPKTELCFGRATQTRNGQRQPPCGGFRYLEMRALPLSLWLEALQITVLGYGVVHTPFNSPISIFKKAVDQVFRASKLRCQEGLTLIGRVKRAAVRLVAGLKSVD
ncbi:hypothetical protein T265_06855 [Opisthorchis viverrini]|uniref:Uncharacterized protein n=1 Tax=Opisthorchis viverrini TaxID=6198 RepID=A0A074ZEZ2_OPIVI|nr:hypothetical protein T265_06855 [Opisthorchis viverrini]KER25753.1 hypothetical protein T265_06855 [Opisthorchis viverrini]